MGLGEIYNYLLVELSHPLSREWQLLSPYVVTFITLGYLYFVLCAGPRYMKDRPPYRLKTFILFYNIIQILANAWFVKEHISTGYLLEYGITCKPSNPTNPIALKLFDLIWWIFMLKIFDYVETCIFVLRKKQNQVSTLHVYHHVSNVTFYWYFLKYIMDERASIMVLVNCSVHIIMYIYYFLAAWSPELQHMIWPMKAFITRIQMIQFVGLILYLLQIFRPDCEASVITVPVKIFIVNLLIFLYLFYDFYKKSYTKELKQKSN